MKIHNINRICANQHNRPNASRTQMDQGPSNRLWAWTWSRRACLWAPADALLRKSQQKAHATQGLPRSANV